VVSLFKRVESKKGETGKHRMENVEDVRAIALRSSLVGALRRKACSLKIIWARMLTNPQEIPKLEPRPARQGINWGVDRSRPRVN